MAVFTPWSKSTNVSVGHSLWRNSSRAITSPGRSSSKAKTSNGWPWSLILTPPLRSSRVLRSVSKMPNRTIRERAVDSVAMASVSCCGVYHGLRAMREFACEESFELFSFQLVGDRGRFEFPSIEVRAALLDSPCIRGTAQDGFRSNGGDNHEYRSEGRFTRWLLDLTRRAARRKSSTCRTSRGFGRVRSGHLQCSDRGWGGVLPERRAGSRDDILGLICGGAHRKAKPELGLRTGQTHHRRRNRFERR